MTDRSLGALQVAALLISASYGIGFLFGSGEYALRHGMAGAIYGVATGGGMLAMAVFAGRLWRAGLAVWDLLGERGGDRVRRFVALLSLVWMAGVLAAQIHGALAVVRLLGAGPLLAHVTALGLILLMSRCKLRSASILFTTCLVASAVVLLYAMGRNGGMALYAASLPAFTAALPSLGFAQSLTIALGVGLLVCTGADYHQFVLSARDSRAAAWGCVLAGVGLMFLAFLPPAMVLSAVAQPQWPGVADPKQVVPHALAAAAHDVSQTVGRLMLAILGVAALGSGAAVLRAMVAALESAQAGITATRPLALAVIALGLAAALTASGLPIVDTMVSVNVIYIASIGVSLVGLLRGSGERHGDETWVMAMGFVASVSIHLASWLGWEMPNVEMASLVAGLGSALLTRMALSRGLDLQRGSALRFRR